MRHVVLVVPTVLATIAAIASAAAAAGVPAHTKSQAEINVLRALAQTWKPSQIPDLVDSRTHLVVNNTQAICSGRGERYTGRRYARFACLIRPGIHRPHKGLYVDYQVLANGRFKITWVAYEH